MPEAPDERHQRVRRALQALPAVHSSLPLANGELSPHDAAELEELKLLITRHVGLDCSGYKERCLRRRIAVRMRARGLHRYRDYGELIEHEPAERDRLLDTVMINVSKFFRNAEVWDALRTSVVPALFAMEGRIRLWSAGCAGGEEPYSLAILLHEHAAANRLPLDRFEILATDIDQGALAIARRAEYGAYALTETGDEVRDRWFEQVAEGTYQVRSEVRSLVRFELLDLLRDDYPGELHFIICRNVIIYFERDMQDRIFERFAASLVPSGFLVLGKVETLFGANAAGFHVAANRERIFRRA